MSRAVTFWNTTAAANLLVATAEIPFELHPGRGRFNAAFFKVMDGYLDWNLRSHKSQVYGDLPTTVVELGSGVGANL